MPELRRLEIIMGVAPMASAGNDDPTSVNSARGAPAAKTPIEIIAETRSLFRTAVLVGHKWLADSDMHLKIEELTPRRVLIPGHP